MGCPHVECYTMPKDNGLHIHWCTRCGALRNRGEEWRYPALGNKDVSDSLVDKAQDAANMSVGVLALRVANLARESVEDRRRTISRITELQNGFNTLQAHVEKHESVLEAFREAIAQRLD